VSKADVLSDSKRVVCGPLVNMCCHVCLCTVGELKQEVSGLKIGVEMENCGVKENCGSQAFSVQLYSGDRNLDPPKICVNGK